MARVLANRDQTWRSLQEYLLAERETFKLVGPDGAPMFGLQKEFMWVAREGRAVRSPVRVNGVAIGEETRRAGGSRMAGRGRPAGGARVGEGAIGDRDDRRRRAGDAAR